jgi:hypothetical protein
MTWPADTITGPNAGLAGIDQRVRPHDIDGGSFLD